MTILKTDRLVLRRLSIDDAEFILELLNEPSFLRYIGDKGVRTVDDARGYILKGPVASYERFGFGLYLVELKDGKTPIGMCGLLKRECLADVEIGFAFVPRFWAKGYGHESAAAVMAHAENTFGLSRVVAVVSPENVGSFKILEKLGFKFEQMVRLSGDSPDIKLFAWDGDDQPDDGPRAEPLSQP